VLIALAVYVALASRLARAELMDAVGQVQALLGRRRATG
jgi:hypothetical protein